MYKNVGKKKIVPLFSGRWVTEIESNEKVGEKILGRERERERDSINKANNLIR